MSSRQPDTEVRMSNKQIREVLSDAIPPVLFMAFVVLAVSLIESM